ncbi:MAG TPA: hypothetical protein DCO86_00560 [Spirochaetaceae bacterium]|nr:hypothetical protein [Spirochaetaceae bacterium]
MSGVSCDTLTDDYSLPRFFSQIVSKRIRGVSEAKFYFDKSIANLHSPFCFESMKGCISRLSAAISKKENVMILSDRDADGLCSLSLMNDFLKAKGVRAVLRVSDDDDGRGLNPKIVESAVESSVSLIIMLDCGSTQKEEIAFAMGKGIDVMVLDHHLMRSDSRPNCIVVNPKSSSCNYPFADLSACGVCSKAVWAYEFSQLDDYDRELLFADASLTGEKGSMEIIAMRNFVSGEVVTVHFDSFDNLLKSGFIEGMKGRRLFVLDDNALFRFLSDKLEILSLKSIAGRISNEAASGDLNRLFDKFRNRMMASRPVEVLLWLYKRCYLRLHPSIAGDWLRFLDLAAISAIADMVPMREENLILVKLGLDQLNKRCRKSLLGFLSVKSLCEKRIDENDVAFSIAPAINAPWRMERADVGLQLFSQSDLNIIDIFSREALDLNDKRRSFCRNFMDRIRDDVLNSISESGGNLTCIVSGELPHGLTGLVANALKNEYGIAALTISTKGGAITGSLRLDANAAEALAESSSLLSDFGGHASAAGFRIDSEDKIPSLICNIRKYVAALPKTNVVQSEYDIEVKWQDIPDDVFEQLDMVSPFGIGNELPRIMVSGISPASFDIIKGKERPHLQAALSVRNGFSIQCVFWNKGDMLAQINSYESVDAVAVPRKSFFKGNCKRYFEILEIIGRF